MGATLDETQLELEAQRARVRGTADRLETTVRRGLNVRAMIGRNPVRTVGLAAGAAFFLLGGPHRTVRLVRRAFGAAAEGDKAYAALPPSLRALVDASSSGFGERKAEARGQLALALHAWRQDPKNRKKADRLVAETLTPPGPSRTFWALVEVAGVTAAGIIAKQVVGRSLAGGAVGALLGRPVPSATPASEQPIDAGGETAPRMAKVEASAKAGPNAKVEGKASAGAPQTGYSGWSGRNASVAGPARDAATSTADRPKTT